MSKRLPVSVQLLYGIGVSYAIVDQIFAQWVFYYFLPPESSGLKAFMAPIYVTLALVLSRFVDMVSDPLVGYLSDKFDSRFGRRIPFIALGSIPLGIATVAFFFPIKNGGMTSFFYLAGVGATFFVFYTIVGAPYNSLIPEIGHTQEERLSLSTWQSVFRLIYTAIAMVLPGLIINYFSKVGAVDGVPNTEYGVRAMVIILSIIASTMAYVTVFFVKEKKYSHGKKSNASLKGAVGILFKDKSFKYYLFGLLFFFIGFNTLRTTVNYYVEDIMNGTKVDITIASALLFGSSALFFYPTAKLSRKIGYRKVMLGSLITLAILTGMLFFLGKTIPVSFGNGLFFLLGIPLAGSAFIFPPAMLGDISSRISKDNKENIEGMCFGVQGFFLKMAFLISIAVLPMALVSGSGSSFLESLFTPPKEIEKSGIYATTVIAVISFIISYVFYYLYREPEKEKVKNQI